MAQLWGLIIILLMRKCQRPEPKTLIYKVKRQSPITPAQKRYLQDLVKYHRINLDVEPESLTKNEASRL